MSNLEITMLSVTCASMSIFGIALIMVLRKFKPEKIDFEIFPKRIPGEGVFGIARKVNQRGRVNYLLKTDLWSEQDFFYYDNLLTFKHAKLAESFIDGYRFAKGLDCGD